MWCRWVHVSCTKPLAAFLFGRKGDNEPLKMFLSPVNVSSSSLISASWLQWRQVITAGLHLPLLFNGGRTFPWVFSWDSCFVSEVFSPANWSTLFCCISVRLPGRKETFLTVLHWIVHRGQAGDPPAGLGAQQIPSGAASSSLAPAADRWFRLQPRPWPGLRRGGSGAAAAEPFAFLTLLHWRSERSHQASYISTCSRYFFTLSPFLQFAFIRWSADPHLLVFQSLLPVASSWITVQKQKQFSD